MLHTQHLDKCHKITTITSVTATTWQKRLTSLQVKYSSGILNCQCRKPHNYGLVKWNDGMLTVNYYQLADVRRPHGIRRTRQLSLCIIWRSHDATHDASHDATHDEAHDSTHDASHDATHDTSMMHHTTQHPILSSATLPFATRKENRFSNERKWLIPPSTAWRWASSTSGSVYPLIFIYCILSAPPPGNSVSLGDATSSKAFRSTKGQCPRTSLRFSSAQRCLTSALRLVLDMFDLVASLGVQ